VGGGFTGCCDGLFSGGKAPKVNCTAVSTAPSGGLSEMLLVAGELHAKPTAINTPKTQAMQNCLDGGKLNFLNIFPPQYIERYKILKDTKLWIDNMIIQRQ
jgi:hypothetical protein